MTIDQKTARALYKKLLGLYPRAFREQLGESMEQTFNDRLNERKHQTAPGLLGFVLGLLIETAIGIVKEHTRLIAQRSTMKSITTSPRSAAIISFMLAMPLTLLFLIAWLEIEPFNGFLKLLFMQPSGYQSRILGAVVLLGAFVLLLMAAFISLRPIVRGVRM